MCLCSVRIVLPASVFYTLTAQQIVFFLRWLNILDNYQLLWSYVSLFCLFISQLRILTLKILCKTSNPKDQHAELKMVCFLDIFVRLLSIFLMTNGSGMQWSSRELVTEYRPNSGNCFGTLPKPGQRDITRQQLTGKEGCDAKEWNFRSKSHLVVKLPRLKDLCVGNMGHLCTKGKKVTWKLAIAYNRKKETLVGQKAHGRVSIAISHKFEETGQQQHFPVHWIFVFSLVSD